MMGDGGRTAIPDIEPMLRDPEAYVRVWAAATLLILEPGHPGASAALLDGLKDEKYFVRSLAVWHLGRLAHCPESLGDIKRHLEGMAGDPDPSVRAEVAIALRHLRCPGR